MLTTYSLYCCTLPPQAAGKCRPSKWGWHLENAGINPTASYIQSECSTAGASCPCLALLPVKTMHTLGALPRCQRNGGRDGTASSM